ncbi:MAG: EAL domain-containing protein [Actinomycetales bacterium]|nr:EAL domain-containing protein [Actinomycetales bacterium]
MKDRYRWRGSDPRCQAMVIALLLCSAMCVLALLIPGCMRGGTWRVVYLIDMGVVCGVTVLVLLRQRLLPVIATFVPAGGIVAITIAQLAGTDPTGARVGTLVLILPTVFCGLFHGRRSGYVQTLAAIVAGAVIFWNGGDRAGELALHLSMLMVSTIMVIWPISAMRHQLSDALERERELSVTDTLTGLMNRRGLKKRFEQLQDTAERGSVTTGLLLIDLDRFQEVNDTLGHDVGDSLLTEIGPRLVPELRDGDTVARLGGDEFAVLLPDVDGVDTVVAIAEQIRAALTEPFLVGGVDLAVEASIGVAVSGAHGKDLATLMQRADVAMYVAKRRSAGVVTYDSEIDKHSPERLAMLGNLRRALDHEQLLLHFQPKVGLVSGEVVGAEALVRWQTEQGMIPPDKFIPLAESTGLIGPLTQYILDAALAQARVFADAGHPMPIAVNLSARNLLDVRLCDYISSLLDKYGVPAGLLDLEVTESAIMTEPVRAKQVLCELNDRGIRIAIDDFGAGYTSLAQLRTLPVTDLKIDRSFVITMATSPENAQIVRSITDLGKNLGLTVIAEGVETSDVMETLATYGCDIAQGYHLSRPLPPDRFLAWCDNRRSDKNSENQWPTHEEQPAPGADPIGVTT